MQHRHFDPQAQSSKLRQKLGLDRLGSIRPASTTVLRSDETTDILDQLEVFQKLRGRRRKLILVLLKPSIRCVSDLSSVVLDAEE